MERKDLLVLYAHNCGEGEEGYLASEADQVMDAYEERIKELEEELKERKQICKDLASQPCGYLTGDK